jgi:hypothetical protein
MAAKAREFHFGLRRDPNLTFAILKLVAANGDRGGLASAAEVSQPVRGDPFFR